MRVAGSDRWDGASKPVGPSQGPSTGGARLVGQDEWEPTTGLEEPEPEPEPEPQPQPQP